MFFFNSLERERKKERKKKKTSHTHKHKSDPTVVMLQDSPNFCNRKFLEFCCTRSRKGHADSNTVKVNISYSQLLFFLSGSLSHTLSFSFSLFLSLSLSRSSSPSFFLSLSFTSFLIMFRTLLKKCNLLSLFLLFLFLLHILSFLHLQFYFSLHHFDFSSFINFPLIISISSVFRPSSLYSSFFCFFFLSFFLFIFFLFICFCLLCVPFHLFFFPFLLYPYFIISSPPFYLPFPRSSQVFSISLSLSPSLPSLILLLSSPSFFPLSPSLYISSFFSLLHQDCKPPYNHVKHSTLVFPIEILRT